MEAAFFDLDKTVIARASMAAFGHTFYRGGLISRRTVLRALVSQLVYLHLGASEQKLARIRESVLAMTRGWDQTQVSDLVREALDEPTQSVAEVADPPAPRGAGQRRSDLRLAVEQRERVPGLNGDDEGVRADERARVRPGAEQGERVGIAARCSQDVARALVHRERHPHHVG